MEFFPPYIKAADLIRKTPGSSFFIELDSFVGDPVQFITDNVALPASADISKVFSALVGPSFVGKTQSAFVISFKPVLYFPVEPSSCERTQQQQIYRNFFNHGLYLNQLAGADYSKLKFLFGLRKNLTATQLDCVTNQPLCTIGLCDKLYQETLAKLELMRKNPKRKEVVTWMEAYSKVGRFEITLMTINEFKRKYNNTVPFCVFLDEFNAEWPSILVRNVARVIGAPCVVSNTNLNISNLVGSKNSSRDPEVELRVAQEQEWSLVFHQFGHYNRQIGDALMGLTESIVQLIAKLRARCEDIGDERIANCFDLVFGTCLDATRPGIAEIVLNAIKNLLGHQERKPLRQILEFIFTYVKDDICYRKYNMKNEPAQLPKLALSFPQAYRQTAPTDDDDAIFNYKSFLDNHLYYLLHPSNGGKNFFLTFIPVFNDDSLRYFIREGFELWSKECTTFNKDGFFTIMSCLNIPIFRSTFSCLNLYYVNHGIQDYALAEASNVNALSNSGNRLEVAASAAIIDASQYSCISGAFSLSGQPAESFLINVLQNCINDTNVYSELPQRSIAFDHRLEACFGSHAIMPFLHGMDLNVAGSVFKSLSSLNVTNGIFVRKYDRCPNRDQIDG